MLVGLGFGAKAERLHTIRSANFRIGRHGGRKHSEGACFPDIREAVEAIFTVARDAVRLLRFESQSSAWWMGQSEPVRGVSGRNAIAPPALSWIFRDGGRHAGGAVIRRLA